MKYLLRKRIRAKREKQELRRLGIAALIIVGWGLALTVTVRYLASRLDAPVTDEWMAPS